MAGIKISADDLNREIVKAMKEYTEEVSEAIEEAKKETAKDISDELKKSTVWADNTGTYRKGFTIKTEGKKGSQSFIVYNKRGSITHLLELGHVNRDGSRTKQRPHFRPIADKHIEKLSKKVEEIIKNGGK